jgi:mannose-6-phosphate isomerase-like protein (cupin superfamily)
MYSLHLSEAKVLDLPGRKVNVLIGSDKLKSERMTVGLTEIPPETDMAPHVHLDKEEIIFIIDGYGEAVVDGSVEKLEPNTAVLFPMGLTHVIKNKGCNPMKFVFMFNPINDFSAVK